MSQPDSSNPMQTFRQNVNLAMFLMRTLATSVEVFIRGNFGSRYLGLQAVAVFIVAPLFAMFKRSQDGDQLAFWLIMYAVMCLFHKLCIRKREQRGEVQHSYYDGIPLLRVFFPFLKCSEVTFKRWVEPPVIMGMGLAISNGDEPFGTYLMLCAASMAYLAHACIVRDQTRLHDLNDAVIDQRALAERFRDSSRDRF